MTKPLIILHTKMVTFTAQKLCFGLIVAGINTVIFDDLFEGDLQSDIQADWPRIATLAPTVIILGSPDLRSNSHVSEMALDVLEAKKALCVIYGYCDRLPIWFSSQAINVKWGDHRGWNQFIQALSRFLPPTPRFN